MILEANKARYLGVSCLRCGSPTPVSAKVRSLPDEFTNASLSFALRCRACEEESVYALSEIQEFEGEPKTRRSRQYLSRSRAAKA
jgi:hypothetical protein